MNSLCNACSTFVATAGLAFVAALASPMDAAAQTLPTLSTTTPGQVKAPVTPQLVRNVDEPGFNPFEEEFTMTFNGIGSSYDLPVPANKIAVIEHVSVSGHAKMGQSVLAFVTCLMPPTDAFHEARHALVLTPQGSFNGQTWYAASQPVKCYAADTNSLGIHLEGIPISPDDSMPMWGVSVSGYLVPR